MKLIEASVNNNINEKGKHEVFIFKTCEIIDIYRSNEYKRQIFIQKNNVSTLDGGMTF